MVEKVVKLRGQKAFWKETHSKITEDSDDAMSGRVGRVKALLRETSRQPLGEHFPQNYESGELEGPGS